MIYQRRDGTRPQLQGKQDTVKRSASNICRCAGGREQGDNYVEQMMLKQGRQSRKASKAGKGGEVVPDEKG